MIKWIKRMKGFTLLELLVVTAIIAMLSSILLPALSKAREKGRQTVCISNLKEIFLAIEMYKNDNDGYYPLCSDCTNYVSGLSKGDPYPSGPQIFWTGAQYTAEGELDFTGSPIYSYLKMGEIKTCPNFKQFSKTAYQPASGGYGYNKQFVGGNLGSSQWFYKQHKDSDIKNPSETVILSDTAGIRSGAIVENYDLSAPYYKTIGGVSWNQLSPSMHFRHNGLANVVWCDGHITGERMSYSRTMYGRDYESVNIGWIGEDSTDPAVANKLYGHHEP
ncbi:MAG: prepilin-type N-terminal cleavage/methylation domain-containing protein [bacterium]